MKRENAVKVEIIVGTRYDKDQTLLHHVLVERTLREARNNLLTRFGGLSEDTNRGQYVANDGTLVDEAGWKFMVVVTPHEHDRRDVIKIAEQLATDLNQESVLVTFTAVDSEFVRAKN